MSFFVAAILSSRSRWNVEDDCEDWCGLGSAAVLHLLLVVNFSAKAPCFLYRCFSRAAAIAAFIISNCSAWVHEIGAAEHMADKKTQLRFSCFLIMMPICSKGVNFASLLAEKLLNDGIRTRQFFARLTFTRSTGRRDSSVMAQLLLGGGKEGNFIYLRGSSAQLSTMLYISLKMSENYLWDLGWSRWQS